jgi:hypothetical protein
MAGFLTLSMFVMLEKMIKHDHLSPIIEVYFPLPLSVFPFLGPVATCCFFIWWRVENLCDPRIISSF